jgi:large subunit ribosomal protein L25
MKTVSISGSPRANVGKKDAKAIRASKSIPCVLYGGKEQTHFSVPEPEFKNVIYTPDVHIVELIIGDKKHNAILQEAQFHKVNDSLLHVDFLEILPGKAVTMNIPVKTTGTSPGVRAGGKLVKKLKSIKVKGPIEKIPSEITVPIDTLEIGGAIRVGDLNIEGVTLLNAANITIVSVQMTRAAAAETAAAATGGKDAKKDAKK